MGGLRTLMPITAATFFLASLANAGIFPLAGFWSKDEILAEASLLNPTVYWLLTIAAFFTAFYMGRQVLMVFFGKARTAPAEHAQESPAVMTTPLIVLAALAALGGVLNLPGAHTFTTWIEHTLTFVHAGEFNLVVAGISTALALLAIGLAGLLYSRRYADLQNLPAGKRPDDPLRTMLGPVFTLWENKYFVDEIYDALIVKPYAALSKFLADVVDWKFWHDWFHDTVIVGGFQALTRITAIQIDLGFIDAAGNFLGKATRAMAGLMSSWQVGYVRTYMLSVVVGVVLMIGYLLLH
jgi:NADH-quinone oxidoreductase subunit L